MGTRTNKKKPRKVNTVKNTIDNAKVAPSSTNTPIILVMHRGSVGPFIPQLVKDVQAMFSPHSVRTIQVLRSTRMKDITAAAGGLHITHTIIFSRTKDTLYMRLCSMPRGPTITFSIDKYCLSRVVLDSQRRPSSIQHTALTSPPCLILYNLQPQQGPKHLQLISSSMLQIFSTFTPGQCTSRSIKRCCLLNYDEDTQQFELRHYIIQLKSSGMAKLVNKLVNSKSIPNLNNYNKIEDAFDRAGDASETEAEEDVKINLFDIKKEKIKKTCVKLKDCGPRLTMKLHKIESGFCGGQILFHRTKKRTPEEMEQVEAVRLKKKQDKLERKRKQEVNVQLKKQAAKDHQDRCLDGMPDDMKVRALQKRKAKEEEEDNLVSGASDDGEVSYDEDEAQYYKDAVGEDPDEELALRMNKNKRKSSQIEDGKTESADAKKVKLQKEQKEADDNRKKSKERYRMLDKRRKTKRPRSFHKRLTMKLKAKAKERRADASAEKDKAASM